MSLLLVKCFISFGKILMMNLLSLPLEVQRLGQITDENVLYGDAWPDYLAGGIREEHIPALVSILENVTDFFNEDIEDAIMYLPMHAWRALTLLGVEKAIPLMVSLLDHADLDDNDTISDDLPLVLSQMGKAVYPHLSNFLREITHNAWARMDAAKALSLYARNHPEDRLRVIGDLSAVLDDHANFNSSQTAMLIQHLAGMKAVEAASHVEQAFTSGRVDIGFFGDWEDFQVDVGLLKERITSSEKLQVSPTSFLDGMLNNAKTPKVPIYPKSTRSGSVKEDHLIKKKRKQTGQSRKAIRQKKKKKK
jgi:hypothetical protein